VKRFVPERLVRKEKYKTLHINEYSTLVDDQKNGFPGRFSGFEEGLLDLGIDSAFAYFWWKSKETI